MADSTTTTYPVARVYKDTGKFEGIEAVECGVTKKSLLTDWFGTVSADDPKVIYFNNGYKLKTNVNWTDMKQGSLSESLNFVFTKTVVPIVSFVISGLDYGATDNKLSVSASNGSDFLTEFSASDTGVTISIISTTLTSSEGEAWGATYLEILDPSDNVVGRFTAYTTSTNMRAFNVGSTDTTIAKEFPFPNDLRFKYVSADTPSVSKQGTCTFSEIVELGNVTDTAWSGEWASSSNINFNNGYKISRNFPLAISSNMSFALQNVTNDIVTTYAIVVFNTSGDTKFSPISSTWTTQIEPLVINRVTMQNTNLNLASNAAWTVYRNETEEAKFENCIYDSSVGTYWDATTDWSIPYYERLNMSSVSKSTGVLTCSEFIEGDYGAEYRCASGFSGTISGNKITCNNGYQFELLLQSDQSAVNWSSVLGGGTGIFGLNGSATEDAINGSTFGGSLNTNDGYNTCTFTDPNSSTSAWITSPTLYVYSILTALVTTELYYLKITDPAGKSVLYENSTAAKETFYPIESGEDEWWIPSKYRYQNYLT